jgi:hypothetical protein
LENGSKYDWSEQAVGDALLRETGKNRRKTKKGGDHKRLKIFYTKNSTVKTHIFTG